MGISKRWKSLFVNKVHIFGLLRGLSELSGNWNLPHYNATELFQIWLFSGDLHSCTVRIKQHLFICNHLNLGWMFIHIIKHAMNHASSSCHLGESHSPNHVNHNARPYKWLHSRDNSCSTPFNFATCLSSTLTFFVCPEATFTSTKHSPNLGMSSPAPRGPPFCRVYLQP